MPDNRHFTIFSNYYIEVKHLYCSYTIDWNWIRILRKKWHCLFSAKSKIWMCFFTYSNASSSQYPKLHWHDMVFKKILMHFYSVRHNRRLHRLWLGCFRVQILYFSSVNKIQSTNVLAIAEQSFCSVKTCSISHCQTGWRWTRGLEGTVGTLTRNNQRDIPGHMAALSNRRLVWFSQ